MIKMKRVIETDEQSNLEKLLGKKVLIMCSNYFYTGTLSGVNDVFIELTDPAIVYETGEWSNRDYQTVENMHTDKWNVSISHIESFGLSK